MGWQSQTADFQDYQLRVQRRINGTWFFWIWWKGKTVTTVIHPTGEFENSEEARQAAAEQLATLLSAAEAKRLWAGPLEWRASRFLKK
jgi:hypothetical protein